MKGMDGCINYCRSTVFDGAFDDLRNWDSVQILKLLI